MPPGAQDQNKGSGEHVVNPSLVKATPPAVGTLKPAESQHQQQTVGPEVQLLERAVEAVRSCRSFQDSSMRRLKASAVTSKPANGGHPKTGQWKTRLGQHLLYPAQPRSGKEFQGKTFLWRAPEGREPRSGWWRGTPSSTLWECGNRAVGDFQARWETTENRRLVFRVFHGAAFP